jgi:hypothetical protein
MSGQKRRLRPSRDDIRFSPLTRRADGRARFRQRAQAVWKLKKSKRDENDILGFDFKIEWACGVGAESALNE